MNERDRLEKLAKAIWEFYYPNGGSVFRVFEDLSDKDKDVHRNEAREFADFLSGHKILVKSKQG